MSILFKDLKIGNKFHAGKSKGAGIHSNIIMWVEYEKIDKSHGKIIKQIGYGNNRQIGYIQTIFPNTLVFQLDK
jgi:hypothetical protein